MAQATSKGQPITPLSRMFKGFTFDYLEGQRLYVIGQADGEDHAPHEILLYAEQIDQFIASLRRFRAEIAVNQGEEP